MHAPGRILSDLPDLTDRRTGNLFEQISRVRNGRLKRSPSATTPLYLAGDLGEGIALSPVTLWKSLERYWTSTIDIAPESKVAEDRAKALKTAAEVAAGAPRLTHPRYRNVTVLEPVERDGNLLTSESIHALGTPVRLVTAPFLDAMGKTAWENMLRRTRTPVRAVWELQRPERETPDARNQLDTTLDCFPRGTGAFAKFFHALEKYLEGPESTDRMDRCGIYRAAARSTGAESLTLIGHSMGTIVLNELIPTFPTLPYTNIVYMAAAASIGDGQRSVLPVLHRNMRRNPDEPPACTTVFYSLMLNPIAEARERTVKGLVLSGSLLEWIDDMFEDPKTTLDRTLGMWRNVRPALHVFGGPQRPCVHFKVFGFKNSGGNGSSMATEYCASPDQEIAHPQTHGAFNDGDKCYWQERFWKAPATTR